MTTTPSGWETRALGTLGHAVRLSVTPEAQTTYELWSVPSFSEGSPEIVNGSAIGSAKLRVEQGDVLICKINPRINRVWRVRDVGSTYESIASPEWLVFRPSDEVDGEYLRLCLTAPEFRNYIAESVSGVTGSHTRAKADQILRFEVPIPPLDEQRRMVAILEDHLSRLDAARVVVDSANRRLEVLRMHAIRSLILGKGLGRPEPVVLAEAGVDDSVVEPLPTGWAWKRLGEVADVVGGVTKDAKKQSDPDHVEVPYLRVANVQKGRLDLSSVTTIRVPPEKADALRLRPGDVLLNEGGDRDKLGRGWVWDGQIDGCIHQNHVFRARVRNSLVDPVLLSWASNTIGGRWCELNGKQSVNLASISLNRIRMMPVPVPPKEMQGLVRDQVEQIDEEVNRLRAATALAYQKSAALRRSLLASAFSGKLIRETASV